MLKSITLRYFGIIEHLSVSFETGLNVLTGESGAGKSIVVDAMTLIAGRQARDVTIYPGQQTAWVEAVFEVPDELRNAELSGFLEDGTALIVRRHFGKNTGILVNDQSVTLRKLKELLGPLIMISGQHDQLQLFDPDYQLHLVDEWLDESGRGAQAEYATAYAQWQAAESTLQHIRRDQAESDMRREMLAYQIQDVRQHELKAGEEDELTALKSQIKSRDQIQAAVLEAQSRLDALIAQADGLEKVLGKLGDNPRLSALAARAHDWALQIADAADEVGNEREQIDRLDAMDIDALESRLELIFRLKQKYKAPTLSALLDLQAEWQTALDEIVHVAARIVQAESAVNLHLKAMETAGNTLHKHRQSIAKTLSKTLTNELKNLGFFHVQFDIEVHRTDRPTAGGLSRVTFLICPNPGMGMQPLQNVASGGEISRIFLAIRTVLGAKRAVPVLIFDEIDTGVGGMLATDIGKRLQNVSAYSQVFCVTHLPQIARFATAHYSVQKIQDAASTRVTLHRLSDTDIRGELQRMVGGNDVLTVLNDALMPGRRE